MASVEGSALLVVGFFVLVSILLCSLSMSGAALSTRLTKHERGSPQHPAHVGVMTWQAQGVMNSWVVVFLSRT